MVKITPKPPLCTSQPPAALVNQDILSNVPRQAANVSQTKAAPEKTTSEVALYTKKRDQKSQDKDVPKNTPEKNKSA